MWNPLGKLKSTSGEKLYTIGHTIISVALLAVAGVMIWTQRPGLIGAALGIVGMVSSYWLVSSTAKNTAQSTVDAVKQTLQNTPSQQLPQLSQLPQLPQLSQLPQEETK